MERKTYLWQFELRIFVNQTATIAMRQSVTTVLQIPKVAPSSFSSVDGSSSGSKTIVLTPMSEKTATRPFATSRTTAISVFYKHGQMLRRLTTC